jgi:hypothetical protein
LPTGIFRTAPVVVSIVRDAKSMTETLPLSPGVPKTWCEPRLAT